MSAVATPPTRVPADVHVAVPVNTSPHPAIAVGERICELDPEELARLHGTPYFLTDLDVVAARVRAVSAVLPRQVELAFAVKANPSPLVLRHLARLGMGADIASGGELDAVIRAGFDVRRIVFTGPGKTDGEIARALRAGIRAITIESLDELDVVLDMAPLAHPRQGLLLRLAVTDWSEPTPIIGADGYRKFGLLPDEIDTAIQRLLLAGAIGGPGAPYELLGLHAFGASNLLDAERLVAGVRLLASRAEDVAIRHGLRFRLLDAGGGLGIPYRDGERSLDLAGLGRGLSEELGTWDGRRGLADARLLMEPGRFPLGPAAAYIVRVVRTKRRGGRTIAIVDGGVHHLLRPALLGQGHRVVAVGALARRPADTVVDVVGPLCTGIDVLASGCRLPEPHAGDLLAVLDVGAYGFTESMPMFLSHPIPADLVADEGVVRVARVRREPNGVWP